MNDEYMDVLLMRRKNVGSWLRLPSKPSARAWALSDQRTVVDKLCERPGQPDVRLADLPEPKFGAQLKEL